ncbi:clostripain-related cysteine peptidase [uncultured Dysgonomonas sp.]|uniref:Clostripain n=1 Tax=uncultured Dysgonomonas sp. TaxID=206096 RepID=A0A212K459_9BACT|nr:clostripain-related cysteine peptidase [uncultured Dysgonomonas sp.]SBW06504.1 conserved hypothetical protein [uncultured Dysgonomonas sp.]
MTIGSKIFKSAIIILTAILSVSCIYDEDMPPANRIILVYLGGDNSLSDEVYEKIEAIRLGWNKDNEGKLLIYSDPSDASPQLIEICTCHKGNPIIEIIHTYEEENSADSKVFGHIINEVKVMYPAPSYGLILFSHASGWLPQETLKNPKSVLNDNKQEMDITDFANAIPDSCFDFIIFEACFMAGIEVAYELKDKTDYILASSAEIVSPGFTEIYKQSAIDYLFESSANLKGFAQSAFNYFSSQSGFLNSATLSIIKTSELDALGNIVKKSYNTDKTFDIGTIQHFDRYTYHLFFDFEDYFSSYLETEIQRLELSEAINSCIIYKAATPLFMDGYNGFEIKRHSGLTTYIEQEQFPYLNTEYQKLKWYRKISGN